MRLRIISAITGTSTCPPCFLLSPPLNDYETTPLEKFFSILPTVLRWPVVCKHPRQDRSHRNFLVVQLSSPASGSIWVLPQGDGGGDESWHKTICPEHHDTCLGYGPTVTILSGAVAYANFLAKATNHQYFLIDPITRWLVEPWGVS